LQTDPLKKVRKTNSAHAGQSDQCQLHRFVGAPGVEYRSIKRLEDSSNPMRLVLLLLDVPKIRLASAIFASILNGISTVAALVCVLHSLRGGTVLWWQFVCFAMLAILSRIYARLTLKRLTAASLLRLRRRMLRAVLKIPLERFERIDAARLLVAFTSDLANLGAALRNFVHLFSGAAFLLACLAYLSWVSPPRGAVTAFLLLLAIAVAILLRTLEKKHSHATRMSWDRVLQVFKTVLEGIKQMRLNRTLARQVLRTFEDRARDMQRTAGQRGWYSEAVAIWIQSISFVILGVAVFGPFNDNEKLVAGGYGILALIYMRWPLQSLIADSSGFADASVALQRLNELGLDLTGDVRPAERPLQPRAEARKLLASPKWNSLTLRDVTFRYHAGHPDDDFTLGPINIVMHPEQIVFVSGGNGSGKTTLLKVLTGLYRPTKGTIHFDDMLVDDAKARLYRSKFAVVFSDFCLFEQVADLNYQALGAEAERLAARFKFKPWMLAPPDKSDRVAKLSSGERRRAALLMAMLEDRPIVVFDEWAADQDPVYKDLFYREILPSMRAKGKLVIVLSHDERYFHLGDRVLWLERGEPPVWRSPQSFSDAPTTPPNDPDERTTVAEPAK
jgi:putative pyoverdin transport system ATP-binding/permease protein